MIRQLLPPRWAIVTIWRGHRQLLRATAGRAGLRRPRDGLAGMLQLRTIGRVSGSPREVILCYVQDGPDVVTLAMNGWSSPDPQWWRNLQAQPDAEVTTVDGPRPIRARAALGPERDRAWALIRGVKGWANDLDAMAALRDRETTVVILEPRGS